MPRVRISIVTTTVTTTTETRTGECYVYIPTGTPPENIAKFCEELYDAGDLSIRYTTPHPFHEKLKAEPPVEVETTVFTYEGPM